MSEIQGPSFDTRGQLGLFSDCMLIAIFYLRLDIKLFQQLLLGFSIFLLKRSVVYLLPEVLQPLIVRPTALVNSLPIMLVALRPRPPLQLRYFDSRNLSCWNSRLVGLGFSYLR
uniref:Uncharacterized protein n=1 Tax=Cacopsylla melanoneura TaxID=428564 RepID=A0A8D8YMU4_9HEMI